MYVILYPVSGVILEGGYKSNIIPERAVMHVSWRAPTDAELHELKVKVMNIVNAGATSTGCTVTNQ